VSRQVEVEGEDPQEVPESTAMEANLGEWLGGWEAGRLGIGAFAVFVWARRAVSLCFCCLPFCVAARFPLNGGLAALLWPCSSNPMPNPNMLTRNP